MNTPKVLKIEITRRCNARCVFCNHVPSDVTTMPVDWFASILEAFPCAAEIQPQWFGEPMLHPAFLDIVRLCKSHRGVVRFYTNGSLIASNEPALRLLTAGDEVIFSVEGRDAPTYERIRVGLKWERLLANVKLMNKIRGKGVRITARITNCREIAADAAAVQAFWAGLVDAALLVPEKPLARAITGRYVHRTCTRPSRHFTVRADGGVRLCCLDYAGKIELGHISDGPRKVWAASGGLRHCHHELCRTCLFKFVPED